MARIFFFALWVLLSLPVMACEFDASTPDKLPESSLGNVTGAKCDTSKDCVQGCIAGSNDTSVLCLNKREANTECFGAGSPPIGGMECGCLPDVKHCGFAPLGSLK